MSDKKINKKSDKKIEHRVSLKFHKCLLLFVLGSVYIILVNKVHFYK